MLTVKLLPYQKRILLSQAHIRALIGGTGTGKTYLLPRWLYVSMLEYPHEEWIVSAPTILMLKRNPVKYIERFFREAKITYTLNKTDMFLETKWGMVYFISAENEERMQGIHPKGIFADEAGLFPLGWWETAIQRIAYKRGFVALLTTPYFNNWLKTEVWDAYHRSDDGIHIENPTSYDNPFYPKENIERARKRLPEWKFKMLFLGQFTKPAGLIYPKYQLCEPFEVPASWNIFIGMDTGYNNPTALVWIAHNPDEDEFYVFKEFKQSRVLPDDIVKALRGYENCVIYADPANKEVLEILKKKGLIIRQGKKDVLAGISHVQGLFENGKLRVFNTCRKTIDELDTYSWEQDKTGEYIDRPVKYNDHLMDALRYALYTYEGLAKYNIRWL